ncbi:MAG: FAD binding domain-containing protein [Coriobacteriales bacterium]|jgi:xanthine dehydrogenase YagS FAD-binding subunit|nr:FAD binding domain-containing protein [Coriobacteriales bacterium]
MRAFGHIDAGSVRQAVDAAGTAGAQTAFIAGGTDLLGSLKDNILRAYPKTVINLKTIADLDFIREEGGALVIGALAKVQDVADSALVQEKAACLAQAAAKVSSPAIRRMGTFGGTVCQRHRCWYFRSPENRFDCLRKGGDTCFALTGDARYHSIFGGEDGCIAVSPQDVAPALVALGATFRTDRRDIAAADFFKVNGERSCALEDGEVLTQVSVPVAAKSAFSKFALRKSIDFAIVNCAVAQTEAGTRVVLGGIAPSPLRSLEAEAAVVGGISEESAKRAGEAAVATASPLPANAYKVPIASAVVARTLRALI